MRANITEQLSLNEKIRFTSGDGAWHTWNGSGKLPQIMMCDGPHGLRKQRQDAPGQNNESIPATCFPTESALACSWNPEAVAKMAQAIAKEALAQNVSIILGCGVNMKRSPLCGRNFEYFSEDPYLAGTLAVSYIKAMQALGVGASLKHFAGNNQETHRQTANSQIDERALREIYLRAFEMAVKEANPLTIMASYNRLNGTYACENKRLLTDILRTEWGYDGTVISDWGACVDSASCLQAGMDLEMPDHLGAHTTNINLALKEGKLEQAALDRAAQNVAKIVTYGHSHNSLQETAQNQSAASNVDFEAHHNLAISLEEESAVLLKNDGFFPIDPIKPIIIIGELAKNMRYQGGGSSHINAAYNIDIISALTNRDCLATYYQGYHSDSDLADSKLEQAVIDALLSEENKAATILFFGGLSERYEGEGYDRKSFTLPANQTSLLNKIHDVRSDVGVITFSGAPFEMNFADWVPGILQMYLGGQGVAEACANLLLGKVSPCGKLAESWPLHIEDVPCYEHFGESSDDIEYRESIFIGYRYYDTYHKSVRFPFGHGLTYTKFVYSDLKINWDTYRASHDGNIHKVYTGGSLEVSCLVKNIGKYAASEIVQCYIQNPSCYYLRAEKELGGFQKVFLEPGQEKTITISLNERSFSIYAAESQQFIMPSGKYTIAMATSSIDIRLQEALFVEGTPYQKDDRKVLAEYFDRKNGLHISRGQFETLYGRPLSQLDRRKPGEFSMHDSLDCLSKHSFLGKIFLKIAEHIAFSMYPGREHNDPEIMMTLQGIHEGCLDSILCQSAGAVPYKYGEAIVLSANGHPIQSIMRMLKA